MTSSEDEADIVALVSARCWIHPYLKKNVECVPHGTMPCPAQRLRYILFIFFFLHHIPIVAGRH